MLEQLDGIIASVRSGAIGELKYTDDQALARSATEYFQQNVLGRGELPWAGRRRGPPGPRTQPVHVGE